MCEYVVAFKHVYAVVVILLDVVARRGQVFWGLALLGARTGFVQHVGHGCVISCVSLVYVSLCS